MWGILVCSVAVIVLCAYIPTNYTTVRPQLGPPPPPLHYNLSADQLHALHRDGAVHLPGVLNNEWLRYVEKVVEDRVSHPWLGSLPAKLLGVYEYHQFDNWMVSPGFMDYLTLGPASSIARAVFPTWDTVRVLKESLFYKPKAEYPALLAPLHVDCETGAQGCPDFPVFRLWVTLDRVDKGRGVVFQANTHNNQQAAQEYKVLHCPDKQKISSYFSFAMEPEDGLVWFGDSVHFAFGGDRRVISVSLIDGTTSRYDENHKPHLSWDWYGHGVEHGDLIQGPYFPQVYPTMDMQETKAREEGRIGYFTGDWVKMWPFIRNVLYNFGGSKKTRCQFEI